MYEVEITDEFEAWWDALSAAEQDSCNFSVDLLRLGGPKLGRPAVGTLKASRFSNLKELRVQHAGRAYRIFFAFDPRRVAILLLGIIKSDSSFYEDYLSRAEQLYARHLLQLKEEQNDA